MALPPTVTDLEAYLGLQAGAVDDLDEVLAAATEYVRAIAVVDGWPEMIRQAVMLRAHAMLVSRGAPTGVSDAGEFGATYMPSRNPEFDKLVAPYRIGGFA